MTISPPRCHRSRDVLMSSFSVSSVEGVKQLDSFRGLWGKGDTLETQQLLMHHRCGFQRPLVDLVGVKQQLRQKCSFTHTTNVLTLPRPRGNVIFPDTARPLLCL